MRDAPRRLREFRPDVGSGTARRSNDFTRTVLELKVVAEFTADHHAARNSNRERSRTIRLHFQLFRG